MKCKVCGVSDPAMFYESNGSMCREHVLQRNREYRAQNIEAIRAYDRERAMLPHRVDARETYIRTPEGRAAKKRASDAWRARNALKAKAHAAVAKAMMRGKLMRQPCEVCGGEAAHAHHDDYSKPLSVRWLCSRHHKEFHNHTKGSR